MTKPSIIALDLEGTLISTAVSQIPRPGLTRFIDFCLRRFARVAIFTAVRRERTEAIVDLLLSESELPHEFADRWEFVEWEGQLKDLAFISDADPRDCVLIDDREEYVKSDQYHHWIRVEEFTGREGQDRELLRIELVLEAMLQDAS